ncbi:MAG: hypothetical protein AAGE52_25640 [Myxococcota bacterium]
MDLHRIGHFLRDHRRRLATLVLVVGLLVVGGQVSQVVPREVAVRYRLSTHVQVNEVRIAYLDGEDEVSLVRFAAEPGAELAHDVTLTPGRYRIEAVLRGADGQRLVHRALRVPADGVVHIDLGDDQ